jgi:hypothetical protein
MRLLLGSIVLGSIVAVTYESRAEKPAAPAPALKIASDKDSPSPGVLVFEGAGGGKIHRAGPEHFKLTRVSDGQSVALAVEYDKETLDDRAREGGVRNREEVRRPVREAYAYNHLFEGIRLFLDSGRSEAKEAQDPQNDGSLTLFARAKLEAGVRYRLTWACWPVGAPKATEVSVELEWTAKKGAPPEKPRVPAKNRVNSISLTTPEPGWAFEFSPDGGVHVQFGALPGDGAKLPAGTVKFDALYEAVCRLRTGETVEGGSQAAFSEKGKQETDAFFLTDDTLFRYLVASFETKWRPENNRFRELLKKHPMYGK